MNLILQIALDYSIFCPFWYFKMIKDPAISVLYECVFLGHSKSKDYTVMAKPTLAFSRQLLLKFSFPSLCWLLKKIILFPDIRWRQICCFVDHWRLWACQPAVVLRLKAAPRWHKRSVLNTHKRNNSCVLWRYKITGIYLVFLLHHSAKCWSVHDR